MSNKSLPVKDIQLELTIDDVNTLLEALGQMPYVKVYMLISKIQEQAGQQLGAGMNGAEPKSGEE